MPRYLFTLASFASLILFAATVFEWSRTCQYAHMTWLAQSGFVFRHEGIVWIVIRKPYINVYSPFWQPAFAFLLLPIIWSLLRLRKIRTRARGTSCPICLYNLTGNTSGVCPECGTDVASKATTGTDSV